MFLLEFLISVILREYVLASLMMFRKCRRVSAAIESLNTPSSPLFKKCSPITLPLSLQVTPNHVQGGCNDFHAVFIIHIGPLNEV